MSKPGNPTQQFAHYCEENDNSNGQVTLNPQKPPTGSSRKALRARAEEGL